MWPSMSSRRSCLPTVKGEAERLRIAWAPPATSDSIGILLIAPALPEIAVVPDVFANADAQPPAAQIQNLRARGRLEVAVLVENVVGGQQRLMKDRADGAAPSSAALLNSGRPISRIHWAWPHPPAAAGPSASSRAMRSSVSPAMMHETLAHQQIARQIAHERQLRGDHQVRGLLRRGLAYSPDDPAALPARSPAVVSI